MAQAKSLTQQDIDKVLMNRYQYLRHFPTSLGTALQILPEKVHCCNYGV